MAVAGGDLRNASKTTFYKDLLEAMGKDGLLTYRYLGRKSSEMHMIDYDGMVIRHDMRNSCGGIMAAPLAIATAAAGGFTDYNSVPAPIQHSLSFLDDGRDVKEIRVHPAPFRIGKTMGFTSSTVVDEANPDRIIAITRGIGVKLSDAPEAGEDADTPIEFGEEIEDSPLLPSLHVVFGGYKTSEGNWALPKLYSDNRSTSGNLHLGPIHIICEAAAQELVARETRTDQNQVEQWDVMFISQGTIGPFVVTGDAMIGKLGRIVVRLILRDEGRDNRIVATATAVYRPAH
jgi:hypothetical protein